MLKILVIILSLGFLSGCLESTRGRQGVDQYSGDRSGGRDPLTGNQYKSVELAISQAGENLAKSTVDVASLIARQQESRVLFKFNTDNGMTNVNFLQLAIQAKCMDEVTISDAVILDITDEEFELVEKNVKLNTTYWLAPYRKYAYALTLSQGHCNYYQISLGAYLDSDKVDVHLVNSCSYHSRDIVGATFSMQLGSEPVMASLFNGGATALFAKDVICGKAITTQNVDYSWDEASGSVSAKVIVSEKEFYYYNIFFADNKGVIRCRDKDDQEFLLATLDGCHTKVVVNHQVVP